MLIHRENKNKIKIIMRRNFCMNHEFWFRKNSRALTAMKGIIYNNIKNLFIKEVKNILQQSHRRHYIRNNNNNNLSTTFEQGGLKRNCIFIEIILC